MASINKLSVRGVRSFSPEDAEQVLEFYTPLTVIVGANGCGKTTIIESLKFAVCGALPPGKTAGQAFVHDPRSIGSSVVKANIKLRFNNGAGNSMVVVRSMEVKQLKAKLNFKQLDGTIRATDQHGQRVSMSHKCTELDRQVPLLLGVSKAILENVVFCHQEDASWPLQEGAVLKKKFDDIFDSTRYTKALDVFAKAKKEYTLKAKDHKAVVAELRSHKHAAMGFKVDVQKHNDQLEDLEDQLADARQAIDENKEEIQSVNEKIDRANEIEDRLDGKEAEFVMQKEAVATRQGLLQEDLTELLGEKELWERLRTFDDQKESHVERKQALEKNYEAAKRELQTIRGQQTELESEVGRLQASRESDLNRRKKRYEKMCEIGTTYGLEEMVTQITQNSQLAGSTQDSNLSRHQLTQGDESTVVGSPGRGDEQVAAIISIPKADMDEYFRVIRKKRDELEEQWSSQKGKTQEQEDGFNNELSELKGKLSSVELRADESRREQSKLRKEIERRRNSQPVHKFRKSNLEDAKEKAMTAAKMRDEANTNPRQKDIPIEIGSLNNKIEELKKKIENDRAVQEDLRSTFKTQSAIEQMKAKCQTDLEELQLNISEYRFSCTANRIEPPPTELPGATTDKRGEQLKKLMGDLSDIIHRKLEAHENLLEENQETIRRMDAMISEKTALYSHGTKSAREKEQRLITLKPSIDRTRKIVEDLRSFEQYEQRVPTPVAISEERPEELLSYLTGQLEDVEGRSLDDVPPKVIRAVLKNIFEKARSSEPGVRDFRCPCCERDIVEDSDWIKFQNSMKRLAAALIQVDEGTKIAKRKYNEWQTIVKGTVGDILEYQRIEKDLQELDKNNGELASKLRERKSDRDKARSTLEQIQVEGRELRELSEAAKRWVSDSQRIALERDQVSEKESNFRMMNSDREGRDLKQVEAELSESLQKKDDYAESVTKLNSELASINERVQQASTNAARLEDIWKRTEAKYEQQLKDEEEKTALQEKFVEVQKEHDKLCNQIAPLKQRIDAKENQRTRARNLAAEEEKRISSTLTSFNNDVTALQNIVDSIDDYEKSNSQEEVGRLESKRERLINKVKEKDEEIENMMPDLTRLGRIVEDQEAQRKNLEENITLLQAKEKLEELDKAVAKIEDEKLQGDDRDRLQGDLEVLRSRNEQLIADRARLEGRRAEIIDIIRGLKRKLSQNEYRDVEEDFRRASIRQDTTEMAVKDIDKYHSALDKALQRYHSIKITEINTIIRDLWTLTYKGEDITNIEIVSGNDSGARSTRSYNYRVVMSKGGGSQMDMRGRCSAGQRVLASIVIRLALAETFCIKFGCISLDEPTVNLDDNNKHGLAVALAQIIASRSQQSNFQLVLITHDEMFVGLLKQELASQSNVSMPEKYFQVRREEGVDGKYYSKIDAIDWAELL